MKIFINLLLLLFTLHFFAFSISAQLEQKAKLVVQTGHSGDVRSIAFSPDGKFVATAGDNTVRLWNVESGAEIRSYLGNSANVVSVAISPDGKILASGSEDATLKFWYLETGQLIKSLKGHNEVINSVVFSPDGKILASGSKDGVIKLWSIETGQEIKSLAKNFYDVKSLAFSPDGKTLAQGSGGPMFSNSPDGKLVSRGGNGIVLWNIESGQEISVFGKSGLTSLTFSPNGRFLVSGDYYGEIVLWDVSTHKALRKFTGHSSWIRSLSFSPNGQYLASGSGKATGNEFVEEAFHGDAESTEIKVENSEDNTFRLWNVDAGTEILKVEKLPSKVRAVLFSPNGKYIGIATAETGLYNLEKREIKFLNSYVHPVASLLFSINDKSILSTNSDNKLWNWEFPEINNLDGNFTTDVANVVFSHDEKYIARGTNKTVILIDAKTGKEIKRFDGHQGEVFSVAFSYDGKFIASGSEDKTIKLWDIKSGNEIETISGLEVTAASLDFSPDGKYLVSGTARYWTGLRFYDGSFSLRIWDIEKKKELFKEDTNPITSIKYSPDGSTIGVGVGDGTFALFNTQTNELIYEFDKTHSGEVSAVAFSPNSKYAATGSEDTTIKIWDVKAGKEINKLESHSFFITSLSFSSDGKYLASGAADGTVKIWDAKTGKELVSLIALGQKDWAIVTPEGLFEASPDARKLMHFVIGLETVSLEQMKDLYYVPGLLKKILKGEPLPKVELFSKKDLFPDVEFSQPKAGQKDLTVKLINRGGGIGQVQILVNGKEFVQDARPNDFDVTAKEAAFNVDLRNAPLITGAENKIEVIAKNAAGSLSTRGTERGSKIVDLTSDKKATETPNIYAIVGGISDYTGDGLKLNFAAKDAEDFAHALDLGAAKLLGGDQSKVHIRLLTSDGDKSKARFGATDAKISTATKADFQNAFGDFKNATTNDVFIVYLSGHGASLNLNQNPNQAGGDTYLYLTQEATTFDKSVLSIENSRKAMTISSDELKDLMKQNKALKQVLILDTCASGQAAESFVQKRELPSDQIRAIERLKDNTGFYVLMGSAADAVSYEASQYGQGLLTYALLQGMKGARLRENQFADVASLFDYAQETVSQMAKNIGGIQQPRIITPDQSRSFDIGKFTTEEQNQIALSNPKPIILRPNLRNAALRFDNLKLSQMMTAQLREISYVQSRGVQSSIVFVEADEMSDAVLPVGDYTIEGDTLKLSVILIKNDAPIGKEITVTGNVSEVEKIIKQIIETFTQSIR